MRRMYTNISGWTGDRDSRPIGRGRSYESNHYSLFSDHGGPLLVKRLLYDSGLRVPLIIRFPDGSRAGERDNRLLSL